MKIHKGFDKTIGLEGLPTLPSGDSYHVCLYNPADGTEYAASEVTSTIEGLDGDAFYCWDSSVTENMAVGTYNLKIYDVDKHILFGSEGFAIVEDPHIEACEEE